MSQPSSVPARTIAAAALACGFVVLLVVIAVSLGGGDGDGGGGPGGGTTQANGSGERQAARTSYVVQNGDTLTSIARRTGVSVERIEALNPGVDPQILISGEKLKLRETP